MKSLSISLVLLPIILAEEYIIDRQVLLIKNSWTDQPDSFMLPSSMCSGEIAANCSAMGGTRIENKCGCSCNKRDEFDELYQSTFGFYENQWKCYANKKVRAHSGCLTIMNLRQDTIHLMILPMAKPRVAHHVPDLTSNCDIKRGKYLECDGKWNKLNTSLVKSRFYLDMDTNNYHYLQYLTSKPSTPTINGRVIRLEIECTQPKKTQCILFKVKGQLKCGLGVTPTSPPHSIWTTNSNSSRANELEQATGYPKVIEHVNGTSDTAGSHGDGRAGMIAGAFAGVIGLFIIVIAIILLSWRRKKRYPVPRRSSFVVENESYGFGVDPSLRFVVPGRVSKDENEYSYSTNGSGELQGAASSRVTPNAPERLLEAETHIYYNKEETEYAVPFKTGTKSKVTSEIVADYEALNEPKKDNSREDSQSVPPHKLMHVHEEEQSDTYEEPPDYEVIEGPFSEDVTAAFPNERRSNVVLPQTSNDGVIPQKESNESLYYSVGDVSQISKTVIH